MKFIEVYKRKYCKAGIISVGIVAMTLTMAGCNKGNKVAATPPGGPPEVGVVTVLPQRGALTTELHGRTSAYLIAEVRPQVSGMLQKRLFTEGADVKAGGLASPLAPGTPP